MKQMITVLFFLLVATRLEAQVVPDFSLKNVNNGQLITLSSYPSCSGIVIIFTSNACPYDEYYRERIKRLARDYQDKVPVLLVNSSPDPAESEEAMLQKAQALGIAVPYLSDKDQTLMKSLGATKSPHAFLLKNIGGKFTVVYKGAIDDNAQVEKDVRHRHLRDAIDIMLTNQSIATTEVRPAGCTIRRK